MIALISANPTPRITGYISTFLDLIKSESEFAQLFIGIVQIKNSKESFAGDRGQAEACSGFLGWMRAAF